MTKIEMRKRYRNIRKNINKKEEKDKKVYKNVVDFLSHLEFDTLLFYYSTSEEVDTVCLIEYFLSVGKEVALPRVEDSKITFYYIKSIKDVEKGKYGIWEPTGDLKYQPSPRSICIVPAICFDKQNNRIGYGGGYYDRFLRNYNGYTIGLSYEACIVEKIDVDVFDESVNCVITEETIENKGVL